MTERTVVGIEHCVVRIQKLDDPFKWSKGDFRKIFSDGTTEPATYDEYVKSIGLPPMKNIEIFE